MWYQNEAMFMPNPELCLHTGHHDWELCEWFWIGMTSVTNLNGVVTLF